MSRARRSPLAVAAALVVTVGVALLVGRAFLEQPLIALGLALGVGVLGAALRRPDIATFATIFLLYSNLPAVGTTFHGVPKIVGAAFPLLLLIPLGRSLVLRREPPVVTPTLLLLVVLLAIQAAGATFAREPARSFGSVTTFALEGVVLYLLITNVLRTRETLRGSVWALLAAGVLMSAVPLYQQATRTFEDDYGGLAQVSGGEGFRTGEMDSEGGREERQARMSGPIGEKNRYAQVMLVLVPFGLSRVFGARARPARVLAVVCTASIALGFTLAFSRGGFVGLVFLLLAMVALRMIDARKALFLAGGVALLLAAMPQYWRRIESIALAAGQVLDPRADLSASDGAVRRRVTEMMAAVRVFLDHPVIGVGPGEFKHYAEEYGNQDALRRIEGGRRAHSLYLETAAEGGALGLAVFLAAIGSTLTGLAAARRATLERDPELANLVTACFLALLAYLVTGVFLHLSYMRYFYLVLALGGAATELALRERASARSQPAPPPPAELAPGGLA